jgi:hypothetical protein
VCEQILGVFDIVFAWSGSDVALGVPVALHLSVHAADGHVVPDIEFTSLVQQRAFDVLLNDEGAGCAVWIALLGLEANFDLV